MCEAHRRYLLYRLGLAGGNSTASDKAQHKSRVDEWVHRMRYTYFPKQELKFSPPEKNNLRQKKKTKNSKIRIKQKSKKIKKSIQKFKKDTKDSKVIRKFKK